MASFMFVCSWQAGADSTSINLAAFQPYVLEFVSATEPC